MRVFITGATGFIGRAVTKHLLDTGHRVTALVRDQPKARTLLGTDLELVPAGNPVALQETVATVDAIINLAGTPIIGPRWTTQRKRMIVDSRVALTRTIVAAITGSARRPSVLISASAVGYYGDCGDAIVEDNAPAGNDFLATLCRDWETAALEANTSGVRVFIPRIGIVLGREGGALAKMITPFRFGLGGPIGSGRQYMPWIHLQDLVALIIRALEDPRCEGPLIAAAPNPVTNGAFTKAIGRALHRPTFARVPAFALRLLLGEAATPFLTGQRARPRRLEELGFVWRYPTIDAAIANILCQPR